MDLLAQIYAKEISIEMAEQILDETLDHFHAGRTTSDWSVMVGFSEYETTAYAHGARLEHLVRLRYEGWPPSCRRCGLPIDYQRYGWLFEAYDETTPGLRHLECPVIRSHALDAEDCS